MLAQVFESLKIPCMSDSKDADKSKKEKVTTFKLTPELTAELDRIKDRDECTKDAVIRRMIRYGLMVDEQLQAEAAARKVAKRVADDERKEESRVAKLQSARGGA